MSPEPSTVDIAALRDLLDRAHHFGLHPWRLLDDDAGPAPRGLTGFDDVTAGEPVTDGNPLHYRAGRELAVAAVNALPVLLALAETALPTRPDGSPPTTAFALTDTPRTFAAMTDEVVALNTAKGHRDEDLSFSDLLLLIVSELGEATDAWRDHRLADVTREDGKPLDVGGELADALIRLIDTCDRLGIDLAAQFDRVVRWGWTRPYQHGGRTMTGDKPPPATPAGPTCADTRPDHDGPVDRIVVYRSRLTGNETDRSGLLCTGHAMTRVFAWNAGQDPTLAVVAELHQLAPA